MNNEDYKELIDQEGCWELLFSAQLGINLRDVFSPFSLFHICNRPHRFWIYMYALFIRIQRRIIWITRLSLFTSNTYEASS
jgi:hypothetical protein